MPMPQHQASKWATGSGAPGEVAYDKHFFSGQDVFVFMYPHTGAGKLIPLPVTQVSIGMSQQKQPIYGAWSYRWDAVAKGQVIVQGEISIVYSYPNMIGQMLGAPTKSDNPPRSSDGSVAPLVDNSKSLEVARRKNLMQDIWGASTDGKTDTYLKRGIGWGNSNHNPAMPFGRDAPTGKPAADYAGHPPFDIIICYGNNPSMKFTDNAKFGYSNWMDSTNEYMRMMSHSNNESSPGWSSSNRLRIEHVELMSAGTMLEVSGQPLQETYSFIARDMTTPNVG